MHSTSTVGRQRSIVEPLNSLQRCQPFTALLAPLKWCVIVDRGLRTLCVCVCVSTLVDAGVGLAFLYLHRREPSMWRLAFGDDKH